MADRFTRQSPCPICDGHPLLPKGRGIRCYGWYDEDRKFARCSRPEKAGRVAANGDGTYSHLLIGECHCGVTHNEAPLPGQPASGKSQRKEKPSRVWLIRDFEGRVQAQHERFDVGPGEKYFRWGANGKSGLNGASPNNLLYGAELLAEAPALARLVICEGEKAADFASEVDGVIALGTVCGSGAIPNSSTLEHLVCDRQVVLWPDNSPDGHQHMKRLGSALLDLGLPPRLLFMVNWPEAPEKADAADCPLKIRTALIAKAPGFVVETFESSAPSIDMRDLNTRVARTASGFLATWADPPWIGIEFKLLRFDRREGEVSAEVAVRSTGPGERGLLERARLNLLSSSTRVALAKKLAARTPGQNLDWEGMLLKACDKVLLEARAGEPWLVLREVADPEEGTWAIPHFLPLQDSTILFGDGGTAKSYLALRLAIALHTGSSLAGWNPSAPIRTGYLDWEWSAPEHRRRMERLSSPHMPDILYRRCSGSLRDQVDQIKEGVETHNLKFLVVDSIALACGGAPEESETATQFFNGLREVGVGCLLIAHVNKAGDTNRPFGSAFWHNSARMTWYAAKQQELGGTSLDLGLFNRKCSADRLEKPIGIRFDFRDGRTTLSRIDVEDIQSDAVASQLTARERIAQVLKAGALTYAEIAEATGIDIAVVRSTVHRGKDQHFVVIPGMGSTTAPKIGLATPGQSPKSASDTGSTAGITPPHNIGITPHNTLSPASAEGGHNTGGRDPVGVSPFVMPPRSPQLDDEKEEITRHSNADQRSSRLAPADHCSDCGERDWMHDANGDWTCARCYYDAISADRS